jgi:hypothetical protein
MGRVENDQGEIPLLDPVDERLGHARRDLGLTLVAPPDEDFTTAKDRWRQTLLVILDADRFDCEAGPILEVVSDLVAQEVSRRG